MAAGEGGKLGNQRGDFEKAASTSHGILKMPGAKTATAMKVVLKRPPAAVPISPTVVRVAISPKAAQTLLKKPSASVKTVGAQRDEDEAMPDIGEEEEEEEEEETKDEINEDKE